jgi:hypothetical protein
MAQRLAALEQEISALRAENERFREQTQHSSRRVSQPPLSDAPGAPSQQRRKPRGAQPGHEGGDFLKRYYLHLARSIRLSLIS